MNKTSQQQAEAMIALHATQGMQQPQGEQPSHEELALLLEGRLSFIRRKEVMSHINADTGLFRHWISLVEANNILNEITENEKSLLQRFLQWLNPARVGFIGTALAAITTIAIVIPLMDESTTISPQPPRTSPGYASSGSAPLEAAVRAGILLSFQNYHDELKQALPINNRLSKQMIPEPSALSRLNPLGIQLGETLLNSYRACQQKDFKSINQPQEKIKQLLIALELPNWPETKAPATFCKQVNKEINNWIE